MKRTIYILLLLSAHVAVGARPSVRPDTARLSATSVQSVTQWLTGFQQGINQLAGQPDSVTAQRRHEDLLRQFFASDTVRLPSLIHVGLHTNPARPWLIRLTTTFWEGNFRFGIGHRLRSVQVVSADRRSVRLRLTVPVTLFGIQSTDHQPVQYRSQWTMDLRADKQKDSLTNIRIQSIQSDSRTDQQPGLTLDIVARCHRQLETDLLQVLIPGSEQTEAMARLRQLVPQDTVLLQTEQRTDTLLISQLLAPNRQAAGLNRCRVVSFDLHYCTDFLRTADGQYTGRLTVLEGVTALLTTSQLYRNRRTDVILVETHTAENADYQAILSNVVLTTKPQ